MFHGYKYYYFVVLIVIADQACSEDVPCLARMAVGGNICVCSESYCDTVEPPQSLPRGSYYHYSTSDQVPGFTKTVGTFINTTVDGQAATNISSDVYVWVNSSVQFQTMVGVGASLTDNSGTLFNSMPAGAQQKFIESFFGVSGLEYTILRVPIACSDFSPQPYTYDDIPGDEDLTHFALTEQDYNIKIPFLKMAMAVSNRGLNLIGSTWTAPAWMKTNNAFKQGYLLTKYHHAFANYHIKFFKAYSDYGIKFWGITQGNEVTIPLFFGSMFGIPSLAMMPNQAIQWTKDHLGPLIRQSDFKDVKILTLDDERPFMSWWADRLLSDKGAAQYVDGIALHWYFDTNETTEALETFHKNYPDKLIVYTESSINTFQSGGGPVNLGDWKRGERYINNMFQNFDHWVVGYTDWNIALNEEGGPTGPEEISLDASVIVNVTSGEFYKQPIFYALGHFSKFIKPGAKKVQVTVNQDSANEYEDYYYEDVENEVKAKLFRLFNEEPATTQSPFPTRKPTPPSYTVLVTAFSNPDGSHTVIAYNPRPEPANLIVTDLDVGVFNRTIDAYSLNSFIYW